MLNTMTTISLLLGSLVMIARAHMVITSPVPYGQETLTNSPLLNDGSDFPCKQRQGVYDVTQMNKMVVGETQYLAFKGGATHGGGSCQVSVTLDQNPTKNSQWKVIHSVIGGCPSNATGNLSDDPNGTNAAVFEYTLPKGMPNGQYTLAWTWFNKIGNREMYMNCAPIQVTGGANNHDVLTKLPNMWVINIPHEQCSTVEGEDFVFPFPGDSKQTPFSTALGSKTIGSGCASMTIRGGGAGTIGVITPGPAINSFSIPDGKSGDTPSTAVLQKSSQKVALPVTTLATITSAFNIKQKTSSSPTTSTALSVVIDHGKAGSDVPSGATCTNGSVSCSSPGSVVCIGADRWGLCDINNCATAQALAGGTTCSDGVISRRSLGMHRGRHGAGRRILDAMKYT